MTTDFRALCAAFVDSVEELSDLLQAIVDSEYKPDSFTLQPLQMVAADARAQLAQPEGEGLTDEELLAVLDKATADFPPLHPEARALNAVEYPLALELRKARAAIAADRARRPTFQPPADGEVEELDDKNREAVIAAVAEALGGNAYDCLRVWSAWGCGTMGEDDFRLVADDDDRVAEIADAAIEAIRPAPQPPADGEGPSRPAVQPDHATLIGFAAGLEPWATWLQPGGCLESAHCELSDLMLAVLTRWGRPAPQLEGEELTDEKLLRMAAAEIGEEFTSSWFLTGRNSLNLEVTPLELLNLTKAVLACRPTPQPPADGEVEVELSPWGW